MDAHTSPNAAAAALCGCLWHFSDTRTPQGRVRFLLESAELSAPAHLLAEGPGWSAQQRCENLDDAALALAWLSQVPQDLYLQALSDVEDQRRFYASRAA